MIGRLLERYEEHMNRITDERGVGKAFARSVVHSFSAVALVGLLAWVVPTVAVATVAVVLAVIAVIAFLHWAYS